MRSYSILVGPTRAMIPACSSPTKKDVRMKVRERWRWSLFSLPIEIEPFSFSSAESSTMRESSSPRLSRRSWRALESFWYSGWLRMNSSPSRIRWPEVNSLAICLRAVVAVLRRASMDSFPVVEGFERTKLMSFWPEAKRLSS